MTNWDFKTCQKVIASVHAEQLKENKWKRDILHKTARKLFSNDNNNTRIINWHKEKNRYSER